MLFLLSDPDEVKLVKKECFYRWYGLTPYYLALTISRLPMQTFFNFIFFGLSYFLPGLPLEWWRFLLFSFVGMVISIVAEGLGLSIGATFSVTVSFIKFLFNLKMLKTLYNTLMNDIFPDFIGIENEYF